MPIFENGFHFQGFEGFIGTIDPLFVWPNHLHRLLIPRGYHISIYAKDDPVLTNEILQALSLLTQTIGPANHQSLWEFAQAVARGYRAPFAFAYNEHRFYTSLQDISETTGHHEEFEDFKNELRERLTI